MTREKCWEIQNFVETFCSRVIRVEGLLLVTQVSSLNRNERVDLPLTRLNLGPEYNVGSSGDEDTKGPFCTFPKTEFRGTLPIHIHSWADPTSYETM